MITVLKLTITFLHYTIVIWKFNNIIINYFQNPQPNILLDKWRLNTSQDKEILKDDFDSISLDKIPNNIL